MFTSRMVLAPAPVIVVVPVKFTVVVDVYVPVTARFAAWFVVAEPVSTLVPLSVHAPEVVSVAFTAHVAVPLSVRAAVVTALFCVIVAPVLTVTALNVVDELPEMTVPAVVNVVVPAENVIDPLFVRFPSILWLTAPVSVPVTKMSLNTFVPVPAIAEVPLKRIVPLL